MVSSRQNLPLQPDQRSSALASFHRQRLHCVSNRYAELCG